MPIAHAKVSSVADEAGTTRVRPTDWNAGHVVAINASTEITSGTLPAARMPALTGDVTTSAGSVATTLSNTGVSANSYTNASITVDSKGRITAASSGSVVNPASPDGRMQYNDGGAFGASDHFYDDATQRHGFGTDTPDAKGHFYNIIGTTGPYNGPDYAEGFENSTPTNYYNGQAVTIRVYARYLDNGQYYYSNTYYESSAVNITLANAAIDWYWNSATQGTPVDYLLVRDINGAGFVDSVNVGNTNNIYDDNGAGSLFWDASVPDLSVTTSSIAAQTRINYNDGSTSWGVHTSGKGYFGEHVGINITPTVRLHAYEADSSKSVAIFKGPQRTSSAASNISVRDENNDETFGASAWAGGGPLGGYGAGVFSARCLGTSDRMMEISPRNTSNGLRLGSIIGALDGAADKGRFDIYPGSGGGAFVHAWSGTSTGRNGFSGVTAPTAKVHIAAGSTAASSAPIKLNSGSLMTSAEVGAIEFLSDKYYSTITTGTARKEFTLNDVALTPGRVPYITTNGRLTDNSALAFNGTNLVLANALTCTASAGSTTDGMAWNDSTQKAFAVYESGIKQMLVGCIFTQTADQTVSNTVTETTILGTGVGTKTLPANFFVAGKTIRLRIGGIYSTPALATPSVTVKVKYGSTVIATVTTTSLLSGATSLEFDGEVLITCRTTGASGTVMAHGDIEYATGVAGTIAVDPLNNGGATTTINTTTSNALDVTVTWDSATSTRIAKSIACTIEVVN